MADVQALSGRWLWSCFHCVCCVPAVLIVCSQVPLSINVVGLCDKLGESMQRLCEKLPERSWDNFRYIQFPSAHEPKPESALTSFAAQTLSGIPSQMKVGGEPQLDAWTDHEEFLPLACLQLRSIRHNCRLWAPDT